MQIDFDGLQQRIVSVPGIAERPYTDLQAGVDGQVFFLESRPNIGPSGPGAAGAGGGGNELWRYRLCDRRATTFASSVAAYEISADRRKLVYRAAAVAAVRVVVQVAVRATLRRRSCFSSMLIARRHNQARDV